MPINWKDRVRKLGRTPGVTVERKPIMEALPPAILTVMKPDAQDIAAQPFPGDRSTSDLAYARQPGNQMTINGAAQRVFGLNRTRIYGAIVVVGNSPVTVHLGGPWAPGATPYGGIHLTANGGSFEFGLSTDCPYLGEIHCITPSGADSIISFVEI